MKNEQYWRDFLKELQRGTSSENPLEKQRETYQKAFKVISKPANMISVLSIKDITLRVDLIRRFPFLAFRDARKMYKKIYRGAKGCLKKYV